EVGNIVADPLLLRFAPPNLTTRGIPGFAFKVTGRAVIHDAAIGGPGPPPPRVNAQAGNVAWIAAGGLIAGFRVCASVNPIATGSRAVVLEPGEAGNLVAGFQLLLGDGIFCVGESLAIDFLE